MDGVVASCKFHYCPAVAFPPRNQVMLIGANPNHDILCQTEIIEISMIVMGVVLHVIIRRIILLIMIVERMLIHVGGHVCCCCCCCCDTGGTNNSLFNQTLVGKRLTCLMTIWSRETPFLLVLFVEMDPSIQTVGWREEERPARRLTRIQICA